MYRSQCNPDFDWIVNMLERVQVGEFKSSQPKRKKHLHMFCCHPLDRKTQSRATSWGSKAVEGPTGHQPQDTSGLLGHPDVDYH